MRRISSTRAPRRHFNGTSLGSLQAERFREQDILIRQLRRVPAEPAPNIGGVRAGRSRARPGGPQRSTAFEPVAGCPCGRAGRGSRTVNGVPVGIATVFSSPLQTIREDFGTLRVDHIFFRKDSLSGVYTVDDGSDVTATP